MDLQHALDISELVARVIISTAVIIGGFWTYAKFFRGRTSKPRLEPHVEGEIVANNRGYQLLLRSKIHNVGLSMVQINRDASGVLLYSYEVPTDNAGVAPVWWTG